MYNIIVFFFICVIIFVGGIMRNINTLMELSYEEKLNLKRSYIKALENRKFRELINALSISEEVATKYVSILEDCSIEFENCKNCEGIEKCKNKMIGSMFSPIKSNKGLAFSYINCRYAKVESYKKNVSLFDIPKNIRDASMSGIYVNDKNRIIIIKKLNEFIKNYEKQDKSKGIYLYGSFGCGKTYLIAALFNELAKNNTKSIIVHVPELLRSIKESFDSDYKERFDAVRRVPLLLLDDIGAEYLTAWARDEVLEPILQYRMDEGLPTFFTSNFSIEELEKHLSVSNTGIDKLKAKRIIERIKQLSESVELVSKNLRS